MCMLVLWLRANWASARLSSRGTEKVTDDPRLLQALRTLELVRRLARPDPGVNVSVSQSVTVEAAAEPAGLKVADLLTAAPRG